MPFTFSHPALVLPLAYLPRKWFSLTGLVIGSMSPDVEYFVRMRLQSHYSHTLVGLFCFDVPVGVVLAYIFHHIIRDGLVDHMPGWLKGRFARFKGFDWNGYFKKHWATVIVSLGLGTASHLLWDSFTHGTGYFVNQFPELAHRIGVLGVNLPGYRWVQHVSSVAGMLGVVYAIWKMPVESGVRGDVSLTYWGTFFVLVLSIVFIRGFGDIDYRVVGHFMVTGISASFLALALTPIIIRARGRQ